MANRFLPHIHMWFEEEIGKGGVDAEEVENIRKASLIGGSIVIHNIPEGLAIGIAFGTGEVGLALPIALAIAIQNIPDGFAMAVPLSAAGVSNPRNLLFTTLSGGAPEPVAAVLGFSLFVFVSGMFPLAAGFAAGAMVAVVFREMVPMSHSHGFDDEATFMFLGGFGLMMLVELMLA